MNNHKYKRNIKGEKMGCGCNKNRRKPTVRTIGPAATVRKSNSNPNVEASLNDIRLNATGMTKEQRDAERKKRIQAIINKKRF